MAARYLLLALCAATVPIAANYASATADKDGAERHKVVPWGNGQNVHSVRLGLAGDDCLDARIEVKLENGIARLTIKEIGAAAPRNFSGRMSQTEGLSFAFGAASCRIALQVARSTE
jgi:hypothetical protein